MSQGEFTKAEAEETRKAVDELYLALSQKKQGAFLDHLNDIYFFISAAAEAAPE